MRKYHGLPLPQIVLSLPLVCKDNLVQKNVLLKHLFQQASPYIFQPVHSIYLLTLAETGLVGLVLLFIFIAWLLRLTQKAPFVLTIAIIQLLILGMLDHYLFTLQQGQMLFTIIVALVISHSLVAHKSLR